MVSRINHFGIGEFAERAGVTVRTLRYYDQIGLLRPSAYSEGKRRLYTEMDYARLQQILTLKLIGLSLDEIQSLLTNDMDGISHLMERQKQVLGQQVRQLEQVIRAIEQAQHALGSTPTWDMEQFIQIIKAVNMNNQADWFGQFITKEQRDRLAEAGTQQSFTDQKHLAEAWKSLFSDIREQMGKASNDSAVQALVTRWDDLIAQVTGGNLDLAPQLNQAYAHLNTLPGLDDSPQPLQEWLAEIREAATFIQRSRKKQ